MKLRVEQEDIDTGLRGNITRCPVARALTRSGFDKAVVGIGVILVWKDDRRLEFAPNRNVSQFIRLFDDGKDVAPVTFVLREKAEA